MGWMTTVTSNKARDATMSRLVPKTTQSVQWVPRALSTEVKQPECEAGQPPPPSSKVKNVCGCTLTPRHTCIEWFLNRHVDNFLIFCSSIVVSFTVLEKYYLFPHFHEPIAMFNFWRQPPNQRILNKHGLIKIQCNYLN